MSETVTQGLLTMPEPCASQQQGVVKLTKILATHILQFAPLEQIPDPFLWIQFRRVAR